MTKIMPNQLEGNVFDRIGKQWMLVTVKTEDKVNTMTASWGGFGFLWNKPVGFIFVRPQRYTYELLEKSQNLSLCFLPEQYRSALNFCGKESGRNCDKFEKTGLTVCEIEGGFAAVEQSELIVLGAKLFAQDIKEENFIDLGLVSAFYPNRDFHRMYVVEIKDVYTNP